MRELDKIPQRSRGLPSWQVRILQVLAARGWLTSAKISTLARTHRSNQTRVWGIGYSDPEKRRVAEEKSGIPSLLTLGFVEESVLDVDGLQECCYSITRAGREWMKQNGVESKEDHREDSLED